MSRSVVLLIPEYWISVENYQLILFFSMTPNPDLCVWTPNTAITLTENWGFQRQERSPLYVPCWGAQPSAYQAQVPSRGAQASWDFGQGFLVINCYCFTYLSKICVYRHIFLINTFTISVRIFYALRLQCTLFLLEFLFF